VAILPLFRHRFDSEKQINTLNLEEHSTSQDWLDQRYEYPLNMREREFMDINSDTATMIEGKHNLTVSLKSTFMGLELTSPVVAGSCPRNVDFESIRQLEIAGIGAIVLPSILQEQLVYQLQVKSNPIEAIEQSGHFPQQDRYNGGPDEYLRTIAKLKADSVIPLIASIHGASTGPWLDYVCKIQDSGADGLELNWQIGRCDPNESGDQVESRMLQWVASIREKVSIPIAFKMNARFTNPASVAMRLQNEGVNGLVLFAHRPHWDVDIDRMHWTIGWELSPVHSLGRTLQGLVETRTQDLSISVAASGGIRTGDDAMKATIAGADVVMMVSEIYRQGPDSIKDVIAGIQRFLDFNQHSSLQAFLQSRPRFGERPSDSMRSEIIDPLTCSLDYCDPTPVAKQINGDCFGHPSH
jgi:dihydroorotate dehydrogenase (fumarate)